ncbi:MAG: RNA polymerase factor sigma-54 [Spirochaetes bacterium]|nr:RNA polymerase factor sigma-54 [Spirochaetota bacterium]
MMEISLRTGLKQSQKLVMTQSLKQAIELLQLSTIELYERISSELVENPVLEEEAPSTFNRAEGDSDIMSGVVRNLSGDESVLAGGDERRVDFGDASDSGFSGDRDSDRKRDYLEHIIADEESLSEHLQWQARLTARDERELIIYQTIITSLDENGFFCVDPSVLLKDPDQVALADDILATIQHFDPVGCAVPDVRSSLRVQCGHFYPDDEVLQKIISDCFEYFEKLDYRKIARLLNLQVDQVLEKSKIIQSLDPYPGRRYSKRTIRYIIPDIDVKLVDGEIILSLNDDWIPGIRINSYYISLLKKKNIEKKLRDYIQDKMQTARYLIKNIASRRNTILRVVRSIMEHQREFLHRGPGHLKPLTHGDVARELNMHESTVSRVTSNKYVQTCWGVFNLKYFFVSRLKSEGGSGETSSDEAMNLIRDVIDHEDAANPCSDEDIVRILGNAGVKVARRTVAKYRSLLRIPPSNKRKKINKIKSGDHS